MSTKVQSSSSRSALLRLRVLAAASLLGAAVFTSGCVAIAAAGAATAGVVWVRGALETHVERDLTRVHRATQEAMKELEFPIFTDRKSGVDAEVVARTALDKKITVVLRQVTPNTTKITIRVGLVGDEAMSNTILERIRARL